MVHHLAEPRAGSGTDPFPERGLRLPPPPPPPMTGSAAFAPRRPPTSHPTTSAANAAVPTRASVISGPRSGIDSMTASSPSSGVATRNAIAAAAGAPRCTRVRYRGTTPQEQMGNGSPTAIPRAADPSGPPRDIHRMEATGRKD